MYSIYRLITYTAFSRSRPPSPHHTHTHHTVLLTSPPPLVCPSNVSQDKDGKTALIFAISFAKQGRDGCTKCVEVLRAVGAEEPEETDRRHLEEAEEKKAEILADPSE